MVVGVVNIVGVLGAQGEHSVEYSIDGEAVVGVVEEVLVKKEVEKEAGVVNAVELVGGETVFGDKRWRGLLVDPQGRVALSTFFSGSLLAISPPL